EYKERASQNKTTEQHTLALELRISDEKSWMESEYRQDANHDAYKFRQLIAVMNRLFKGFFHLPEENHAKLREDQKKMFA
ncbi:MAG: hypothetical protein OET18_16005, partial [Desulfobacterales bacterium]|nr:hypothetical protein [Desulfobacterales bacterium]